MGAGRGFRGLKATAIQGMGFARPQYLQRAGAHNDLPEPRLLQGQRAGGHREQLAQLVHEGPGVRLLGPGLLAAGDSMIAQQPRTLCQSVRTAHAGRTAQPMHTYTHSNTHVMHMLSVHSGPAATASAWEVGEGYASKGNMGALH